MSKFRSILGKSIYIIIFFASLLGSLYLGQFRDIQLFEYIFFLMTIFMSILWLITGISVMSYGARGKTLNGQKKQRFFMLVVFPLWFSFYLIVGIHWYPLLGLFGMLGISVFTLGIYTSYRGGN